MKNGYQVFLSGVALFWLCVCLAGCATKSPVEGMKVERLAQKMSERLALAEQVALAKYDSGAPVQDVARERVVIAEAVAKGQQMGVDPSLTERFFAAQILASRIEQERLLTGWRRGDVPTPTVGPVDLKTTVRPKLDKLTDELLAELTVYRYSRASSQALAEYLRKDGYTPEVVRAAVDF